MDLGEKNQNTENNVKERWAFLISPGETVISKMIQMEKQTNKQKTWERDHKITFYVVIMYLSSIGTLSIQNWGILEIALILAWVP